MPNILQVPVPNGAAGILWNGRSAPGVNTLLLMNQDLNNTVFVGNDPTITANAGARIPIAPNGSLSVDPNSPWYVVGAAAGITPLVVVPNGTAFFLGLTQGLGSLAIPSIHSPNFVHNVSGWNIAKDGSAEFNNLTIRGTFFGVNYIINNTGLFFYNPSEAFGNLVLSISPNGGIGPFGETILPGMNIVNGTANLQLHVNGTFGAPATEMTTGVASEAEHAALYTLAGNVGLPTELINTFLFGPGSSSDNTQAALALTSNQANGASEAAGIMNIYVSGISHQIAFWDVTGLHIRTPGNTLWKPVLSQTDAGLNTANTTGALPVTKVYTIAGNDIQLNNTLRITNGGTITIGSTAQILTFVFIVLGSTAIQLPIGAAEFLANTTYWYRAQGEAIFNPVGVNGQYFGSLSVELGVTGSNQATVAGTAQTAGGFAAEGTASGIDTTIAHSFALDAKWGAIVGSPSVAGRYSTLEMLG